MSVSELQDKLVTDYRSMFKDADPEVITEEVKVLEGLPSKGVILLEFKNIVMPPKAPLVLAGPITPAAREMAFQNTFTRLADRFLRNSIRQRNYTPEDVINRVGQEVVDWGHLLTPRTKNALKVFFETEARVADFTGHGLSVAKGGMAHEAIVLRWGWEEARHKRLLYEGLVLSGVLSNFEALALSFQIREDQKKWQPEDHPGLTSENGFIFYGAGQEKETHNNYEDWLMMLIRKDYGLIDHDVMTPEQLERAKHYRAVEAGRGYLIGLCHLIEPILPDEAAHHTMYLQIGKELIRYKPESAIDALHQAQKGFTMPLTRVIRGGSTMVKDIYGKGAPAAIRERQVATWRQVNRVFGFEDLEAIANAGQKSYSLKELLTEPGVAVMRRDGSFEAYNEMIAAL